MVEAYLKTLFRHAEWDGQCIGLLGVGEKGTPAEGAAAVRRFLIPPALGEIHSICRAWADGQRAAFIVPALLHPSAIDAGDVRLDKVYQLTAVVVDLDSGDTAAKQAHAELHLGKATMVVESGGRTDTGHAKRHVYWLLSEPTTEVERLAEARKLLAAKVGGDRAFGRATQIIRIPGSVHGKNGAVSLCQIVENGSHEYHLSDILDAIEAMPAMPGVEQPAPLLEAAPGGMMDFSRAAGMSTATAVEALHRDIRAGGEDLNRWGEFSKVAGFHIAEVRAGRISAQQAVESTYGWMLTHMVPPWPQERFDREFQGLVSEDMKNHGPFPAAIVSPPAMHQAESVANVDELLGWAVHKRSSTTAPERRQLVEGYIFPGKRHMLVAEGGAGKTGLCLELALRMAAASAEVPQTWMGCRIRPEAHGGTVIIMTGEDDLEELDIRWNAIDPGGVLRRQAGDRLIALPLDNLGGAFPLVAQHPATREAVASGRWIALYTAIAGIKERGGKVSAVIIDTLNSTLHGEENSAAVIGEYIRAVSPICGDLGAALVVTHHVRKAGAEPIKTLDDMLAAIRGSTALPNAMRVVIGAWPAHDYDKRLRAMGMPPTRGSLYRMGICKANIREASRDVKSLLRTANGLLEDVTAKDIVARGPTAEMDAWLEFAIEQGCEQRVPFARTGVNGLFQRRTQLHPMFHNMTKTQLEEELPNRLLTSDPPRFLLGRLTNTGNSHRYLYSNSFRDRPVSMDQSRKFWVDYSEWYYDHAYDCIERKQL